jgi:copper chaperone CopZ
MNHKPLRTCLAAICGLALLAGCYRQEILTFTVNVPQLRSESCGKFITDRLVTVEGVKAASIDLANKQIHVEYLSTKIAKKNIEFVIAGAGYDANERPGNPAARNALPEDCR